MQWKIRGKFLDLSRPRIMAVLNLTPDSFSDGGKYLDPALALKHAEDLIAQGADILDLGAESTRPGADPVSEEEEIRRLLPVLSEIAKRPEIILSVDTIKPGVARRGLEAGAHIINDVSGLGDSGPEMAKCVREFEAGLVLMHRRGNPKTMASLTHYRDLIKEVRSELQERLQSAQDQGIDPKQIVLDPGLGFAKTPEDSIELLRELPQFLDLGCPILVGPSRKSFIGKITGRETDEREAGTIAACVIAFLKGANLFRVHEPQGVRDALRVAEAFKERGGSYVRAF